MLRPDLYSKKNSEYQSLPTGQGDTIEQIAINDMDSRTSKLKLNTNTSRSIKICKHGRVCLNPHTQRHPFLQFILFGMFESAEETELCTNIIEFPLLPNRPFLSTSPLHIQTSRIVLCETSNYREQVAWFPIIDLVDISCPWVATDAHDRMNRIEYVVLVVCICKPDKLLHNHVTK